MAEGMRISPMVTNPAGGFALHTLRFNFVQEKTFRKPRAGRHCCLSKRRIPLGGVGSTVTTSPALPKADQPPADTCLARHTYRLCPRPGAEPAPEKDPVSEPLPPESVPAVVVVAVALACGSCPTRRRKRRSLKPPSPGERKNLPLPLPLPVDPRALVPAERVLALARAVEDGQKLQTRSKARAVRTLRSEIGSREKW